MPQFLVTCIFMLAASGMVLLHWGLFAANAAYRDMRRALMAPGSDEMTERILSELPTSLGGYLGASIGGAALFMVAFQLYRRWHSKYGAPTFPPAAS